MYKTNIVFASVAVAAMLLCLPAVISLSTNDAEEAIEEEKAFITQTIEIPEDQLQATYGELTSLFESGELLYFFLNNEGNLDYEFVNTIDGGRTEIVSLWNGWRIYLSSEVVQGAILAGDTTTYLLGFFFRHRILRSLQHCYWWVRHCWQQIMFYIERILWIRMGITDCISMLPTWIR